MTQAREALDANFLLLKDTVFGLNDKGEDTTRAVVKELLAVKFISSVMAAIGDISFENRKHFKDIVNCVLHKDTGVEHMLQNIELVYRMIDAVLEEQSQTALLYLDMIKTCCQREPLAKKILASDRLPAVFKAVEQGDFAVSASAFLVVRELLVTFPALLVQQASEEAAGAQLVQLVSHLVTVGSGSQKKKTLEAVGQMLEAAPELVPRFAASVAFAKALESSVLAKGKVAETAAPLLKLTLESEAVTDEVRHVYGQPPATKDMLIEVLTELKLDALPEMIRRCE